MPVHSPSPTAIIPAQDVVSFYFGLAQSRLKHPGSTDCPLLVDAGSDKSYNFANIKRMSTAIARGLKHRGFINEQGKHQNPDFDIDGVAIVFSPTDICMSAIHYGTLMAGGTFAAMDSTMDAMSLGNRLVYLNSSAAFVTAELLPTLLSACNLAGVSINKSRIFITQGDIPGYTSLVELIEEHKDLPVGPLIPPMTEQRLARKIALIVYTSGTTGNSKGVMLTHRNIVATQMLVGGYTAHNSQVQNIAASKSPQQKVLSALPPWHIYGISVLFYQPLATGSCIVQLPQFGLVPYLAAIEKFNIKRLCATPGILYNLIHSSSRSEDGTVKISSEPGRNFNVDSVKTIVCGGASVPPVRLSQFVAFFGGASVVIGYGATETCSIIAGSTWGEPEPGATGILYPNTCAIVIDEHGNETDGYGELCISGPQVMPGYIGQNIESPFVNGFYRVGDYARVAANGCVFLRGRIFDIVHIEQGLVSPTDIENMASEHPAVKDCAAIGTKPKGATARVLLFIVRVPDVASLDDINDWIRIRAKLDIECREIQDIPKSSGGKILRNLLR